jgi:hypothetical protein
MVFKSVEELADIVAAFDAVKALSAKSRAAAAQGSSTVASRKRLTRLVQDSVRAGRQIDRAEGARRCSIKNDYKWRKTWRAPSRGVRPPFPPIHYACNRLRIKV